MSTEQTWQTNTLDVENTLQLAAAIGGKLKGGEVIELASDVGGGKTTFVRGLAQGMGSSDHVHSPSFTIGNEYKAGSKTLYHFDFYRLQDPGIMQNELAEALQDPHGVIVVEWAGIVENVLPDQKLRLQIHASASSESERLLLFTYPAALSYLLPL